MLGYKQGLKAVLREKDREAEMTVPEAATQTLIQMKIQVQETPADQVIPGMILTETVPVIQQAAVRTHQVMNQKTIKLMVRRTMTTVTRRMLIPKRKMEKAQIQNRI